MTRRAWTAAEDACVREVYASRPVRRRAERAAKLLGRSPNSVRQHAFKLGLPQSQLWSAAELRTLTQEWGEVSERKLRAKLPNRSWAAIANKVARLKLPSPVQGLVLLADAAAKTGFSDTGLRRLLERQGVRIIRHRRNSASAKSTVSFHWMRVDLDEVVEAIRRDNAYRANRWTLRQASAHWNIGQEKIAAAMRVLAAQQPIDGADPQRGRPWFVTTETVELALKVYEAHKAERRRARA
jgi:hypothetical protein